MHATAIPHYYVVLAGGGGLATVNAVTLHMTDTLFVQNTARAGAAAYFSGVYSRQTDSMSCGLASKSLPFSRIAAVGNKVHPL